MDRDRWTDCHMPELTNCCSAVGDVNDENLYFKHENPYRIRTYYLDIQIHNRHDDSMEVENVTQKQPSLAIVLLKV